MFGCKERGNFAAVRIHSNELRHNEICAVIALCHKTRLAHEQPKALRFEHADAFVRIDVIRHRHARRLVGEAVAAGGRYGRCHNLSEAERKDRPVLLDAKIDSGFNEDAIGQSVLDLLLSFSEREARKLDQADNRQEHFPGAVKGEVAG